MGRVDRRRAECAQGPHRVRVNSVAISRDGMRIVSGSYDKTVRMWDASTGAELNVLKGHTNWVNSVAISRDGMRIVSGSS
jgi:WD40 repeat protein